jgi:uncharacterized protein YeeX (DUF496 family)
MEYLELVLLITVIVILFRQTHKKIKDTEDQAKNIEDKLEATYKLLKELQPKGKVEIPVRLDDEVVNEMTEMTKQDMEEYQAEKAEFQKKMKEIKEKYKDDIQYEGTEYGGPDRLTREQAQEMLARAKYRKANKLK